MEENVITVSPTRKQSIAATELQAIEWVLQTLPEDGNWTMTDRLDAVGLIQKNWTKARISERIKWKILQQFCEYKQ